MEEINKRRVKPACATSSLGASSAVTKFNARFLTHRDVSTGEA
jgi:hypothetical protein